MFSHHVQNDVGSKLWHGNEFFCELERNFLKRYKRGVYDLEDHVLILDLLCLFVLDRIKKGGCGSHRPSPQNEVFEREFLFKISQYAVYEINSKNTIRMSSFSLAP